MSNITAVSLNPEGRVFAGERFLAGEGVRLGNAAMVAVRVVGQKGPVFDADFVEEFGAGL